MTICSGLMKVMRERERVGRNGKGTERRRAKERVGERAGESERERVGERPTEQETGAHRRKGRVVGSS